MSRLTLYIIDIIVGHIPLNPNHTSLNPMKPKSFSFSDRCHKSSPNIFRRQDERMGWTATAGHVPLWFSQRVGGCCWAGKNERDSQAASQCVAWRIFKNGPDHIDQEDFIIFFGKIWFFLVVDLVYHLFLQWAAPSLIIQTHQTCWFCWGRPLGRPNWCAKRRHFSECNGYLDSQEFLFTWCRRFHDWCLPDSLGLKPGWSALSHSIP